MPLLRSTDSPLKLRLNRGDILTVSSPPGASASVVEQETFSVASTVAGSATSSADSSFGPYSEAKLLTITCTAGASSYDIPSSAIGSPIKRVTNLITGYDSLDAESKKAATRGLPILIGGTHVDFGDSMADNGFLGASNDNGTAAQMLHGQAEAELGAPFDKYVNCGVSGENTEEILLRVPAGLTANNPTVVTFSPMLANDYDDQFTSDRTLAATTEMVRLAVNFPSVRLVRIQTTTPTSSQIMNTATGARGRKLHSEVRTGLRSIAAQYGGLVELIDTASIVSAADGSGLISGYATVDGTHFNYRCSERVSTLGFKPALSNHQFEHQWKRPYSTTNFKNILGPCGSAPSGDNATGTAGTVLLTGVTGTLPNGLTGRRFVGDTTTTAVASSIASPLGYAALTANLAITLAADGGSAGISVGRAASVRNNYDNAWAATTAYTFAEKVIVSADYTAHVFAAGTTAGTVPAAFATAVPGDMVTDGTVTWLITRRPKPGDVIEFVADMSLLSLSGSGQTFGWCNLIASSGTSIDRFLNYAGVSTYNYPTTVDGSRRMYRQRFTIPTTFDAVKGIQVGGFFIGKNGTTATLQTHGLSVEIVS